jgi:hypothetical protein
MFAGSILDLEPDTSYEAQFVLKDPDGVRGEAEGDGRTRAGADAGGRRQDVSRLSAGFKGQKVEPRSKADVRLQPDLRRHGLGHRGRPRVKPGDTILVHAASTNTTARIHQRRAVNRTVPLDGTYYLTADGTADARSRSRRRRRRGDLRRRRQLRAVRRARRRLHLLRRDHVLVTTDYAIMAGTQFTRRINRIDGQALRVRERRVGLSSQLRGLEQLTTSPTTSFIGPRRSNHVIGWNGNSGLPFNGSTAEVSRR